jgi:hypothetical protein
VVVALSPTGRDGAAQSSRTAFRVGCVVFALLVLALVGLGALGAYLGDRDDEDSDALPASPQTIRLEARGADPTGRVLVVEGGSAPRNLDEQSLPFSTEVPAAGEANGQYAITVSRPFRIEQEGRDLECRIYVDDVLEQSRRAGSFAICSVTLRELLPRP